MYYRLPDRQQIIVELPHSKPSVVQPLKAIESAGATFARLQLGFMADETQSRILNANVHRALLNCTRQWGKSTVTAAKAVHRAYSVAQSLILVLSPSARQSAEFLRK